MHRHSGVLSAVLITLVASTSVAQTRTGATAGVTRGQSKPAVVAAKKELAPQAPSTANKPAFSLHAGIASGDGAYDLGIAVGGAATWSPADLPIGIRGDVYFAHHGGGSGPIDLSLNLFGLTAQAVYTFPTSNSSVAPYVLGGLGLFYANVNIDYEGTNLDTGDYDSSTDLGLLIGGGLNFTPRLGAEIRFMDAGGFTTFPILLVIKF